jgi:hypothetical protein
MMREFLGGRYLRHRGDALYRVKTPEDLVDVFSVDFGPIAQGILEREQVPPDVAQMLIRLREVILQQMLKKFLIELVLAHY